jgi:2-hydroxychromene-2-carboxylate isomerase
MNKIEFWFDFSSPYAYLASVQIEAVAARHARAVRWRPFLLGPAMKATGMQPLTHTPLRGDYARRDWARLARLLDVPFALPDPFPIAALAPGRAFYFVEEVRPDLSVPFARRVFRAYYSEGVDISAPEAVQKIAAELGLDAAAIAEALGEERLKQKLRAAGDEALARGVFGSPFFIVDGEPFWGSDRIPMLENWLATGGW